MNVSPVGDRARRFQRRQPIRRHRCSVVLAGATIGKACTRTRLWPGPSSSSPGTCSATTPSRSTTSPTATIARFLPRWQATRRYRSPRKVLVPLARLRHRAGPMLDSGCRACWRPCPFCAQQTLTPGQKGATVWYLPCQRWYGGLVDQHEAVPRQIGVHALAEGAMCVGRGAVCLRRQESFVGCKVDFCHYQGRGCWREHVRPVATWPRHFLVPVRRPG